MKQRIKKIFYSFPVQLLAVQLRSHLLLIFIWLLLALFITGRLGSHFGIQYLYLEPEYIGLVNFWSFFILGMGFGAFFLTWNLTSYLLNAPHFPFLASLSRPLTKFVLNNFIIPLSFLVVYFISLFRFEFYREHLPISSIFIHFSAFIIGAIILVIIGSIYLAYTNKDILDYTQKKSKLRAKIQKSIQKEVDLVQSGFSKQRVDTYITEKFKLRLVRNVSHYDREILMSIFKQNHINALFLQLFSLVILIVFGYLMDFVWIRIPAGVSLILLMNILISITGATTYWFSRWRIPVILFILFLINYLTSFDFLNHKNKAYGLNYTVAPSQISVHNLNDNVNTDIVEQDKAEMLKILNNWRAKFGKKNPKMIFTCVSGGGLKASVWAMNVLQNLDKETHGKFGDHTFLFSGASGGIIGTAYYRELCYRRKMFKNIDVSERKYLDDIAKDLLNSVCFSIVSTDLFLPWVKFKVDGQVYKKDRAYLFEKQLNENTNGWLDKRLNDYKDAEQKAIIPLLFITPSIVNDARRLIVSPQSTSFMTIAPIGVGHPGRVEVDGVEFKRVFQNQSADRLRFSTALRMNATYPYILPNVHLPSSPQIEVMDAGFRDNFGVKSAVRFIHVFKDWILENTDGVLMIQILGLDHSTNISKNEKKGIIQSFFNPLSIAADVMKLQEYDHDTNIGLLYDVLGPEHFDVLRFSYMPSSKETGASMSFHLTNQEKLDVIKSIDTDENRANLKEIKTMLK